MSYIPILRTAQAEFSALKSLSKGARKKVIPYLYYRDGKQPTFEEFCNIASEYRNFFLEFPDHPDNRSYKDIDNQFSKFKEIKEKWSNVVPVISNVQKVNRRQLIQHGIKLLKTFDKIGVRIRVDNKYDMYIAMAIYDFSQNPANLTVFVDFGRLSSKEDILSKFPFYIESFGESEVVFTGTVWGEDQTEFNKNEVTKVDNYLYLAWSEMREKPKYYSDTLTDNLNSVISSLEKFPFKIIPYFKWTSMDGCDFLVIRAEESKASLAKKIAFILQSSYPDYFHQDNCEGCKEISEIADEGSEKKSNPMTRKKMSFIHHMEVITSVLS